MFASVASIHDGKATIAPSFNQPTVNWEAARFDYISNYTMTLAEIAEKYHAAPATVWRCSRQEGRKEQRKAASEKLIEKVREKVVPSESEQLALGNARHLALAQKLEGAVDQRLERAPELSENALRNLAV